MKSVSVRDLRYHFSKLEARLRQGEEVEIRRRKRVIAKLVPMRREPRARQLADFELEAKRIFGRRTLPITIAEIVAYGRGDR